MDSDDGMLACHRAERYCLDCERYTMHAIAVYLERVLATCEDCGYKAETHRIPGTKIGD